MARLRNLPLWALAFSIPTVLLNVRSSTKSLDCPTISATFLPPNSSMQNLEVPSSVLSPSLDNQVTNSFEQDRISRKECMESSLDLLLGNEPGKYSREKPACPDTTFHHIHVFLLSIDNDNLNQLLHSIRSQAYPSTHIHVWILFPDSEPPRADICHSNNTARSSMSETGEHEQSVNCLSPATKLSIDSALHYLAQSLSVRNGANDIAMVAEDHHSFHSEFFRNLNKDYLTHGAWVCPQPSNSLPFSFKRGLMKYWERSDGLRQVFDRMRNMSASQTCPEPFDKSVSTVSQQPSSIPLHVLVVVDDYPHLARQQLEWLDRQEGLHRNLHVHFVCSGTQSTTLKKLISNFQSRQNIADISVSSSSSFHYLSELFRRKVLDKVFIMNDFHYVHPNVLSIFLDNHTPRTILMGSGDSLATNVGPNKTLIPFADFHGAMIDSNALQMLPNMQEFTEKLLQVTDEVTCQIYLADAVLGWDTRRVHAKLIDLRETVTNSEEGAIEPADEDSVHSTRISIQRQSEVSSLRKQSCQMLQELQASFGWDLMSFSKETWGGESATLVDSRREWILKTTRIPFYVYDDPHIDIPFPKDVNLSGPIPGHLYSDALADMTVINAMKASQLRTRNPKEAALFFIPLCNAAVKLKFTTQPALENTVYIKAFDKLLQKPHFQGGRKHMMVSTWWARFEYRMGQAKGPLYNGDVMYQHYHKIWNVTVAGIKDRAEIQKLYDGNAEPDYHKRMGMERFQMTRSTFSVGLLAAPDLPYFEATYEKFKSSEYFIFYRTRPTDFHSPHSTEFRRAPLSDSVVTSLPNSSIGFDLSLKEWQEQFISSKFCLAMRGDDPSTHAVLRSIKVGCIPVVISDSLPRYSPTFKSTVKVEDYCIFIKEADFLKDPRGELVKLTQLPELEIKQRLRRLTWAQRVFIPDHPKSLFVPAFLREAVEAQRHERPETSLEDYRQRNGVPWPL